jgi:hypothetical protein
MQDKIIDFYQGFEGEPEITFYYEDHDLRKGIIMWIGYFDNLMHRVKVDSHTGKWGEFACYYHTATGWDDEQNWPIPNLKEAKECIQYIDVSRDEKVLWQVKNELLEVFNEAIEKNTTVFINYF